MWPEKHTKETCFEVVGFPEWWEAKYGRPPPPSLNRGGHPTSGRGSGGRAAVTVAGDGAPATIGGSTEAASTRGNTGDRRPTEDVNGGVASANMASGKNKEAAETIRVPQGNLGLEAFLHSSPPSFYKPYIEPHCLPPDPLTLEVVHNDPNYFENRNQAPICEEMGNSETILCKNRFEILGNVSTACAVSTNCEEKNDRWIFDCGATDTMTYDASDITEPTKPGKAYIQTASGEVSTVEGAGTVNISSTLKLSNCLYVPSLSHKLLSISHVTRELNCSLLMQPNFYLL